MGMRLPSVTRRAEARRGHRLTNTTRLTRSTALVLAANGLRWSQGSLGTTSAVSLSKHQRIGLAGTRLKIEFIGPRCVDHGKLAKCHSTIVLRAGRCSAHLAGHPTHLDRKGEIAAKELS